MSWKVQRFDALVGNTKHAIVGGPFGSKLTTRDYVDEGVPVIRGSNMSNGRYILQNDFVYVTEEKKRNDLKSNLARPGDLIFTQRGTLGQVAMVPHDASRSEFVVSQSQMRATLDPEKADTAFYYYFFSSKTVVDSILNMTSSSGVPHINLGTLKDFEVPVPPLPTQKRIASILSTYDDLIENNRRRIALLEQAARLLYREWFVHLRFPGHELAKIVDGLPEGWERKKVRELLQPLKAKPKIQKGDYQIAGQYPCVDQGQVFVGGYTDNAEAVYRDELPLIVFGDHTRSLKFIDFPFARGADGTQIIKSNHNRLSQEQFYFALVEVDLSNYFYARHFKFLKDQDIVIPDESTGANFTVITRSMFSQIGALNRQIIELARARDLLLPRLMDGRVPV